MRHYADFISLMNTTVNTDSVEPQTDSTFPFLYIIIFQR